MSATFPLTYTSSEKLLRPVVSQNKVTQKMVQRKKFYFFVHFLCNNVLSTTALGNAFPSKAQNNDAEEEIGCNLYFMFVCTGWPASRTLRCICYHCLAGVTGGEVADVGEVDEVVADA
jgi:hypothetical protein